MALIIIIVLSCMSFVYVCTDTGHLNLYPPCGKPGESMSMECCLGTRNPVTWYTSITDKETPLKSSGLPNASYVPCNDTCQWYTFVPTLEINGTVVYCSNGNTKSNNVTVLVTTGCEFAMHVYISIISKIMCF